MAGTTFEETVSEAMLHNASLFLRKAAEEIVRHDDTVDEAFDVDRATLVTVFIQLGVELVCTAIVLRSEGLAGIVKAKDMPPDAAILSSWEAGKIRTINFEEIKPKAAMHFGDDGFWSLVDDLQRIRNKLVHFHAPFHEADRFDLKYDSAYVILQIVVALHRTAETDLAYVAERLLGEELFQQMLSFSPYRSRVAAHATELSHLPLRCPMCSIRSYLPGDEICIGCGWSYSPNLLGCPDCGEVAVIYDDLNLPFNVQINAVCGNCSWRGAVSHCSECMVDYVVKQGSEPECPWTEDHGR